MPVADPRAISSTTQHYLEISDITNDLVILRDGTVAMVLTTNSLNFGLLSEEEQDAIIYTYAGLLNSLTFPTEIVIRSQRKDITTYLRYLQDLEQNNVMPIRKTQINRYRQFIEELVKERNILDKKFYVVVPYTASSIKTTSPVPQIRKNQEAVLDKSYILEKARNDLEPKRDHLITQFGRIGLGARQLNTQELIHLMYTIYNPGSSDGQKITATKNYTTPLVEASLQGMMEQPALQSYSAENASVIGQTPSLQPEQQVAQQQYQPQYQQQGTTDGVLQNQNLGIREEISSIQQTPPVESAVVPPSIPTQQ